MRPVVKPLAVRVFWMLGKPACLELLLAVRDQPGRSGTELAAELGTRLDVASAGLHTLKKYGLVLRRSKKGGRGGNTAQWHLSALGQAVLAAADQIVAALAADPDDDE